MDHHGIAHIDTYMGNAGGVVCPREKHKVAGSDIRARYGGGNVVKPLRSQSPRIAYAAVCQHIAYKAAAIKGSAGRAAAPYIGEAQIFFRFLNHDGKGFISKCRRGNIVVGIAAVDILVHIFRAAEQIRAVAQRGHIQRILAQIFLAHDIHRDMGQVEVFKGHIADIVGVGYLYLVFIGFFVAFARFRVGDGIAARAGFRPVPGFRFYGFG